MKKALKIIGIIVLVAVIAVIVIVVVKAKIDANTPIIADNYQEVTKTGGDIEAKYLKNGEQAISYKEENADGAAVKYEVYYPTDLETADRTYPVIVYVNGSNVKGSQCAPMFKHWASWGFVVVATEDTNQWNGKSASESLDYLLKENRTENSIFFGKIDVDHIGITGHSQGGVGVFNAITIYENSAKFKTAVPISPTHEELAEGLKWHYDLSKVNVPVLMIAGTKGDGEIKTVIPLEKMQAMYEKLNVPKAMARKQGCEHNDTDSAADGYITAWFLWQLKGDTEAAKAFTGETPELLSNKLYQNQKVNLDS